MFVFIITDTLKIQSVHKQLKSKNIGTVTVNDDNQIILKIDYTQDQKLEINKLVEEIKKIKGVMRVSVLSPHLNVKDAEIHDAFRTNRCVLFFDIDSTLTQGSPGVIHPKIEKIFNKIKGKGIKIFLATGRSMPDLYEIIKHLKVEKYAIAENGGIILGFDKDGYYEFGDKTEPTKLLDYIQFKYSIPEDMKQGHRLTEVIFLQKDVKKIPFEKIIKENDIHVEIHDSTDSRHISKKGINKGSAMLELCRRLHINTKIIAIGDSDMDIPMLKKADYSYAVGNATDNVKAVVDHPLEGKFEKGIEELYNIITSA